MAPHDEASYDAFHGREAATDTPRPIGKLESIRNLVGAVWRHRGDLSSNGVAAAKDIIPELPLNDPIGMRLSNEVMHMLWGSMLHPPSSYRGARFQYRSADGRDNSMLYPDIGKGGQPYAKSIQAQRAVHAAKPDVGDLFDLLMARDDEGIESKTGISSMLLYQATIVIHDVFRTNDTDKNISDTSSYLDLSPLYGANAKQQRTVRLMRDGLLKPDTFAEHRLLNQPPGVSIFLIMYNRFHNYVAKQLVEINENNKFGLPGDYDSLPADKQKEARTKQDEDLFQTARLITCGLYAQVAIHDYLRCLMMQHSKDTAWTLDPRREYSGLLDKETVARGQGNMVSVEFNLLYRFHSALSKRDVWWSEELFSNSLKPFTAGATDEEKEAKIKNGETSAKDMRAALEMINAKWKTEYKKRKHAAFFPEGFDPVVANYEPPQKGKPFEPKFAFKRNGDYFDDAQMVAELVRCMEDPMCSFGSNQIPKVFKSIEMLGLLQSRKWEVCTLNEFRRFFKMTPHKRFEDINTNPKICNKLRDLYVDVESVELYPGYLCEGDDRNVDPDAKLPNNGASALWRGIFSDAVTLVRSDRFYTTEWNVDSITSYGMREVTSDPTINKGGLLYKLCHRAFPGYFKYNSLHLWEPYYTAERNLMLAYEQNKLKDLDLEGLEYQYEGDLEWRPLDVQRNSEGVVSDAFFREVKKNEAKKQPKKLRVRRMLTSDGWTGHYRGQERAEKVSTTKLVLGAYQGKPDNPKDLGEYDTIKKHILGGKDGHLFVNPANVAAFDIPKGALREILTNQYNNKRYHQAIKVLGHCMNMDQAGHIDTSRFRDYFLHMAEEIRVREQRKLQKAPCGDQVYQIDIVADYAIPIIARFFADWLGIWDRVKTVRHPNREFSENKIYELFDNCQDYQSWDSDQTKGMKRRQLYVKSIRQLKALADEGVFQSSAGLLWWRNFFRTYGADEPAVVQVRKLAVQCTQALLYDGLSYDEVASIMLQFALDSAHKVVHNITEVLAYFIDPANHTGKRHSKHWAKIQQTAYSQGHHGHKLISKYVLEAMRLSPSVKLARQYTGEDKDESSELWGLKKGQVVLLDISAASQNKKVFPSPEKFNPDRPTKNYLIHGEDVDVNDKSCAASFGKQLSLAYLTSLVHHMSTMRRLRVAHEERGRLKRINLPVDLPGYPAADQLSRYASPEWDVLLPFPCSWEVRFDDMYDGTRDGVFGDDEGDNADTGNGMDNVYVKDDLSVEPPAETDQKETVVKTEEKAALKTSTKLSSQDQKTGLQVNIAEIPTPQHARM